MATQITPDDVIGQKLERLMYLCCAPREPGLMDQIKINVRELAILWHHHRRGELHTITTKTEPCLEHTRQDP